MPRALEELGYLTLKRARRASQKPKRQSRKQLEAKLSQANATLTDSANAPTTCADNSAQDVVYAGVKVLRLSIRKCSARGWRNLL